MVPFWGRAQPIWSFFSGDWDVHWSQKTICSWGRGKKHDKKDAGGVHASDSPVGAVTACIFGPRCPRTITPTFGGAQLLCGLLPVCSTVFFFLLFFWSLCQVNFVFFFWGGSGVLSIVAEPTNKGCPLFSHWVSDDEMPLAQPLCGWLGGLYGPVDQGRNTFEEAVRSSLFPVVLGVYSPFFSTIVLFKNRSLFPLGL